MKTIAILIFSILIQIAPLFADDWMVQGKTYPNVSVLSSNDYQVQIASNGQVSTLLLKNLPSPLQIKFGYDQKKAEKAEKEAAKAKTHSTDDLLNSPM